MQFLLAVSMGFYLRYLNRKQEARRVAMGLPNDIKDMSIMTTAEADAYKVELAQLMAAAGVNFDKLSENAFDDMTDFQNPMFRESAATVIRVGRADDEQSTLFDL